MGRMGVVAVGAYLKMLADVQPGTVAAATARAGVQAKYIWRLEHHEIKEPSARVLRLLTESLRGSWEDVGKLIADETATAEHGRSVALAWAVEAGLVRADAAETLSAATPDELGRAAEMLRQRAEALQGKKRRQ